jgi:hypothetical protein
MQLHLHFHTAHSRGAQSQYLPADVALEVGGVICFISLQIRSLQDGTDKIIG